MGLKSSFIVDSVVFVAMIAVPASIASAGCADSPLGTNAEAIIGGRTDTDPAHAAAVRIRIQGPGGETCSGSLVTHDTVLTAAHCVAFVGQSAIGSQVIIGPDTAHPIATARVVACSFHPSAYGGASGDCGSILPQFGFLVRRHDLAFVRLNQRLPAARLV